MFNDHDIIRVIASHPELSLIPSHFNFIVTHHTRYKAELQSGAR